MPRVAINGFGRMGRLSLRAAWDRDLEFVRVNEPNGDAATAAHLMAFDSVHGRWGHDAHGDGDTLTLDGRDLRYTGESAPAATDWDGVDVVLECSGRFRTIASLQPYFDAGVQKVIVAAPVKDDRALNIVMGVNDDRYDPDVHDVLTAASCTTNCLAPVVKVIHEGLGIEHVRAATLEVRTRLEEIGLAAFVKTSGGKGFHVVVPLEPNAGWDGVKGFAHDFAKAMEAAEPERYTATLSKKARKGRIFIDYLRNGRGSTTVAPWSTRAKPAASVSVPVTFDLVEGGTGPADFTVGSKELKAMLKKADPWAEFFSKGKPLDR